MTKKILITEDDPSFIRAISHILTKEGYEVLNATNGLVGLMMAQKEKPDLLVLDVMLPGLDGFEVCNRLRADPKTARLPILMLSAKGQDADKSTGMKVGADMYLTKPVDRAVLLSTIESMLAKVESEKG
ncbi:MAG: response regulator [Dehalococcoidia bacterium]